MFILKWNHFRHHHYVMMFGVFTNFTSEKENVCKFCISVIASVGQSL